MVKTPMLDRRIKSVLPRTTVVIFWAAIVLALCSGRAAAQPDTDEPYGKIVKEIRLPELKWTKGHDHSAAIWFP